MLPACSQAQLLYPSLTPPLSLRLVQLCVALRPFPGHSCHPPALPLTTAFCYLHPLPWPPCRSHSMALPFPSCYPSSPHHCDAHLWKIHFVNLVYHPLLLFQDSASDIASLPLPFACGTTLPAYLPPSGQKPLVPCSVAPLHLASLPSSRDCNITSLHQCVASWCSPLLMSFINPFMQSHMTSQSPSLTISPSSSPLLACIFQAWPTSFHQCFHSQAL